MDEAYKERLDFLRKLLNQIPPQPQRQDSLHHQLQDLIAVANQCGMYDAADFLRRHTEETERKLAEANRELDKVEARAYRRAGGEPLNSGLQK